MPPSDPSFWEVPVSPDVFDTREGSLFDRLGDPTDGDEDLARWRKQAVRQLRILITSGLTERQREIVDLYYFRGQTQADIAAALGISQQAVSRQLFGVVRRGNRVGGAIKRLRRARRGGRPRPRRVGVAVRSGEEEWGLITRESATSQG